MNHKKRLKIERIQLNFKCITNMRISHFRVGVENIVE